MKEIKKSFARNLRKEQTHSETVVWKLLRNRRYSDLKFRRQHVIEGFVIDFFCKQYNLAIELDGSFHKNRKDYDSIRQSILESKGIIVLRFSNKEIEQDPMLIFKKVRQIIKRASF